MPPRDPVESRISRLESRLTKLELQWMHLQRDVEKTDELLLAFGKKLDSVDAVMRQLTNRVELLQARSETEPPDEKPPHY
jgi:uncharacterized coiled-coil protein SlyX